MSRIEIANGTVVDYDVHGDRTPVVLVPGLGHRRQSWCDFVALMTNEYRLYAYDVRGFAGVAPDEDYTLADLAGDLIGFVEALEVAPVPVVAHSGGGFVALEACLARPDLFDRLVLGASAAFTDDYGRYLLRYWARIASELGSAALAQDLLLWNYSPHFINGHSRETRIMHQMIDKEVKDVRPFLRQNMAFREHDTRDRLPYLDLPVLLLGGDVDIVMTLRHNRLLHDLLPRSSLVTFRDVGHHLFSESPQACAEAVRTFFNEIHDDIAEGDQ